MPPQFRGYVATQKSVGSIIIVAFLVLVAYVFLSTRKGGKGGGFGSRSGGGSGGRYPGEGEGRGGGRGGGDDGGKPKNQIKRERRADEEKKKNEERKKKMKKPVEWAQPDTAPPLSAAPNHRSATPTKSALRKRNPNVDSLPPTPNTQAGNHIKWVDEEKGLPSPVTKQFRKWEDYHGLTDVSGDGTHQEHERTGRYASKPKSPNASQFASDPLKEFKSKGKLNLPDELLKMLKELETISKAGPNDEQLWNLSLQDIWDNNLGNVPKIAATVVKQLIQFTSKEEVIMIIQKMFKRQENHKRKGSDVVRNVNKLLNNIGVKSDSSDFVYKFLLGWYLESFRAKSMDTRMRIDDKNVKMTNDPKTSKTAFILGWLEHLGDLNKAQRLFVGWDLSGLTMRAQAMKENNENNEKYRLDVTIFLPSESESLLSWADRFTESCACFRHFHTELIQNFHGTTNDATQGDIFTRRRLIFRPGWEISKVDISKLSDPTPNQSVGQRTLVERKSKVLEILPDEQIENGEVSEENLNDSNNNGRISFKKLIEHLGSDSVKKALSRIAPGEVLFNDLTQYQWYIKSLPGDNNSMSSMAFTLAHQIIGKRLQTEYEVHDTFLPRTMYDFIRSLDCGSYIPLHPTNPKRFLDIDVLPALELLILTYLPGGQEGSTVEIMLDPAYGLTVYLENHKKPTQHLVKAPIKMKLYIVFSKPQMLQNFQNDLNQFYNSQGALLLKAGKSKAESREIIHMSIAKTLNDVFIVDESSTNTSIAEGQLPKAMKLDYKPTFSGELFDPNDQNNSNGNPPPPPAPGPTPAPPGGGGTTPTSSTAPAWQSAYSSDVPSPFLSNNPGINRPPGPEPQNSHGPFSPPPSATYRPPAPGPQNDQDPFNPPPGTPSTPPAGSTNFTKPETAQQAYNEAQQKAQNLRNSQTSSGQSSSNYKSPPGQDDDEDVPIEEGGLAGATRENLDGHQLRGGDRARNRETYIP